MLARRIAGLRPSKNFLHAIPRPSPCPGATILCKTFATSPTHALRSSYCEWDGCEERIYRRLKRKLGDDKFREEMEKREAELEKLRTRRGKWWDNASVSIRT